MASRVKWNTTPDNENENFEKLKPMPSHRKTNKPSGTTHNTVNTVDTTLDGVCSAGLNICLISGLFEYKLDLSTDATGSDSLNWSFNSANVHDTRLSTKGSDTTKSTLYKPLLYWKFLAFDPKSF